MWGWGRKKQRTLPMNLQVFSGVIMTQLNWQVQKSRGFLPSNQRELSYWNSCSTEAGCYGCILGLGSKGSDKPQLLWTGVCQKSDVKPHPANAAFPANVQVTWVMIVKFQWLPKINQLHIIQPGTSYLGEGSLFTIETIIINFFSYLSIECSSHTNNNPDMAWRYCMHLD